jgi:DNA-binding response OmpR family regulator
VSKSIKKSILIIDDEEDFADGLAYFLSTEGFDVVCKTEAKRALDDLARVPDLILLDLMMPSQSGIEMLEDRHNSPPLGQIPIIIMSASSEPKKISSMDWKFIKKPFDIDQLLALVKSLLTFPI